MILPYQLMSKLGNLKSLGTVKYGLFIGNVNLDLKINSFDRILVRTTKYISNIYSIFDLNMDGKVTTTDKTITRLTKDITAIL
jgi:hypothetical protein